MAYADVILANGPALYWRLGEPSGTTAQDSSPNNRDGTYGSAVLLGQTGALAGDADTAVLFPNDVAGFVSSSYNPFTNGTVRTFECWARRASDSARDVLFSDYPTASNSFWTFRSSGQIEFSASSSVTWNAAAPGLDEWYHLVLTFDEPADTAELYVNGVSQGTRTVTAWPGSTDNLAIGIYPSFPSLGGLQMDEFAVYEAVLSPEQILADFVAGTAPPLPAFRARQPALGNSAFAPGLRGPGTDRWGAIR